MGALNRFLATAHPVSLFFVSKYEDTEVTANQSKFPSFLPQAAYPCLDSQVFKPCIFLPRKLHLSGPSLFEISGCVM